MMTNAWMCFVAIIMIGCAGDFRSNNDNGFSIHSNAVAIGEWKSDLIKRQEFTPSFLCNGELMSIELKSLIDYQHRLSMSSRSMFVITKRNKDKGKCKAILNPNEFNKVFSVNLKTLTEASEYMDFLYSPDMIYFFLDTREGGDVIPLTFGDIKIKNVPHGYEIIRMVCMFYYLPGSQTFSLERHHEHLSYDGNLKLLDVVRIGPVNVRIKDENIVTDSMVQVVSNYGPTGSAQTVPNKK